MAVTHYTLTASFTDLLGAAYPTTGTSRSPVVAFLETNIGTGEAVVDSDSDLIALGPYRLTADSAGLVTFANLIGSDSDPEDIGLADGTLQYRVRAEYVDAITRKRGQQWYSGWFSLTADVDLADVVTEVYAPAEWQTAFMQDAQAILDAQLEISGLTGEDEAVALLIDTPSSETATSLAASYADATLVGKKVPNFAGHKVYMLPPSGVAATDQARIDDLIGLMAGLGGGLVQLTPAPASDPYLFADTILPSNVQVRGAGESSTYVKAPDSFGVGHVFVSEDFATLKGSNTWLTSAGVPVCFGIGHMTVDGNKSGRGLAGGTVDQDIANAAVAFYGKNFLCDGLRVINSPGDGWYSECANGGGQTDETDLPEGGVGRIYARLNDGVGVHVRGPHDGRWGDIISLGNGREGWVVEQDGATYNGTCDVDFAHIYVNNQRYATLGRDAIPGVRFTGSGGGVRIANLTSESNFGPAIEVAGGNTVIGTLFGYNNYFGATTLEAAGKPGVILSAEGTLISNLKFDISATAGGSGVLVTGASVRVSNLYVRGYASTGVGLDVDAANFQAPAIQIANFSGTGAHAVRINATSGRAGTVIKGKTYDCANGLTAGINGGSGNMYIGLDHRIDLAVEGTSGAQTAHNLDTNFVTGSTPVNSKITVIPRGSTVTTKLLLNTIDPVVAAPQFDVYTTPGTTTWTKPTGAVRCEVFVVGAGGGGGSGRRGPTATIRSGGAGGAGGLRAFDVFDASTLGSTENITIGAGGTGGAAVTADATNGNPGNQGGSTYFGTSGNRWINVPGALGGSGGVAAAGAGGGSPAGPGGSTGASSAGAGTAGASGNGPTTAGTPWTGAGGGSGGGLNAADATSAGGSGGLAPSTTTTTAPAGGTAPGGAGTAGIAPRSGSHMPGGSGAGGASATAGAAGAGGAGASPGGGGGGGGASQDGQTSGAGGNGGNGMIVVITYFG